MRATLTLSSIAMMAVLLTALGRAAGAESASVRYSTHRTNGIGVHVIDVNLNDRSLMVKPRPAGDTPGARQTFAGFLAQHRPLAQITGGYFDVRSGYPIGDVIVQGKTYYDGAIGSGLALTADNKAAIIDVPPYVSHGWAGYTSVLQGGVRLVKHGQYAVYPRDQGFRDPDLFRRASRTAVGLTARNHLLLVATSREIYLSQLAAVMLDLGCREAMTLDGGTSTGLAYGGSIILRPGRSLPNVLQVVLRPTPLPEPAKRAKPREPKVRPGKDWTKLPPAMPIGAPSMMADPDAKPAYRNEPFPAPPPGDIEPVPGVPQGEPAPLFDAKTSPAALVTSQNGTPQKRTNGKRRVLQRDERYLPAPPSNDGQ
ncbi:MAG: phosphodiester glycosidase family protein [Armatimonadota bacterium]